MSSLFANSAVNIHRICKIKAINKTQWKYPDECDISFTFDSTGNWLKLIILRRKHATYSVSRVVLGNHQMQLFHPERKANLNVYLYVRKCVHEIFLENFNLLTLLPVYHVLNSVLFHPDLGMIIATKCIRSFTLRWCLVCTQMEKLIDLEQPHTINKTFNNNKKRQQQQQRQQRPRH